MIFNELSILTVENGQEEFNSIMSQFLKVCHKISTDKKDSDFYCTQELFLKEFVPGYTIYSWLNNPQIPRNEKDLFRKMANKKQLLDKSHYWDSEFITELPNGDRASAVGCLAAYEAETYVVSMPTITLWKQEEIKGIYVSAEKADQEAAVRNCYMLEQVEQFAEEERQKIFRMVSSGRELWEKEKAFIHIWFFVNAWKNSWKKLEIHYILK